MKTPEQRRAKQREWYLENRLIVLAKLKAKTAANPLPHRERAAAWRAKNPERAKAAVRARHKTHGKIYRLRSVYDLSVAEYTKIYESQKGLCAICEKPLTLLGPDVSIDHDHAIGNDAVRGLLCGPCNKGLGHFMDSRSLLLAAERYLARFAYSRFSVVA